MLSRTAWDAAVTFFCRARRGSTPASIRAPNSINAISAISAGVNLFGRGLSTAVAGAGCGSCSSGRGSFLLSALLIALLFHVLANLERGATLWSAAPCRRFGFASHAPVKTNALTRQRTPGRNPFRWALDFHWSQISYLGIDFCLSEQTAFLLCQQFGILGRQNCWFLAL